MLSKTPLRTWSLLFSCFVLAAAKSASGQSAADPSIPDAPEAKINKALGNGGNAPQVADRTASVIKAGQSALPLGVGGKLAIATKREFGIGFITSPAISAGYSHGIDSAPHFGTDRAGFGERYGAAAFRRAVDTYSTYGIYAAAFHDDPRYYQLGSKAKFNRRALYAASRAVITRRDNGSEVVNLPGILGPATAQAAAVGFYPSRDRNAGRVFSGTATSIGINAALFEWSEFGDQLLHRFRHK